MPDSPQLTHFLARAPQRLGQPVDTRYLDGVDPLIRQYFRTGTRVRVVNTDGWTRTGLIGATDGWRPSFLLRHRTLGASSFDLLGPTDRITHVQTNGRTYVPVKES